jgi:hypothetical protein
MKEIGYSYLKCSCGYENDIAIINLNGDSLNLSTVLYMRYVTTNR